MSRRPAKVTQADVARALRAAKQVGARSAEVRLPDGSTIVVDLSPPLTTEGVPLAPAEVVL